LQIRITKSGNNEYIFMCIMTSSILTKQSEGSRYDQKQANITEDGTLEDEE
jgi:hypothetical protein